MRVLFLMLALVSVPIVAQEKATLTTPVSQTSIVDYEIQKVEIGRKPDWHLRVFYVDNRGVEQIDNHFGVAGGADVLVKALNKANLSTKSLECRALEHLRDEGKIGAFPSCSGSPQ